MIEKLARFFNRPASRRSQRLGFIWSAFVTRWWYGPSLRALGKGSVIGKPLFWTPEYIEVGDNVLIWPGSRFEAIELIPETRKYPPRIILGDGVSFQQYCHVTASRHVEIGARTAVLFGAMITDTDHRYGQINVSPAMQSLDVEPTIIGENCFIGAHASIQAGTKLGRHCIVGTNAVVRGTFPDFCVIVGAPAYIVKRFDPEQGVWRRTGPTGDFL